MHPPHSPADTARILAPWRERLQSAREPEAVAQVVREYLSEWTPQRLAGMPRLALPIEKPDDISSTAVMLVQRQYADLEGNPDLHELAEFFAAASRRLAEVLDLAIRGSSALERRPFF